MMELRKLYQKIESDYETVLRRFCNDENMLGRFVVSFPDDPTFEALEKAVTACDYQEIESRAHSLKGVSANLGFDRLQEACAKVVLCVRQERFEEIADDFQPLKRQYEKVVEEISGME